MTVFNPNSTTVSGVDALLVNVANSTVLVRDGVYLTTDGAGFKAINCTATNVTMLMDGYAVSDDSHAIEILSNSEIAIGTQGGVVANQNGINGTGLDNEIVNDGVIESWFEEPGLCDNHGEDPYGESSPENLLSWLKGEKAAA